MKRIPATGWAARLPQGFILAEQISTGVVSTIRPLAGEDHFIEQIVRMRDSQAIQLTFINDDGTETTAADWRGEIVLLVFMRWLG